MLSLLKKQGREEQGGLRVAVVGVHIMVVQAVPAVLVAAALVAMVILLHLMGLLEQSIPEVAAVVVALIQIPE